MRSMQLLTALQTLVLLLFWGNSVLKHQPLRTINTRLPFTLVGER